MSKLIDKRLQKIATYNSQQKLSPLYFSKRASPHVAIDIPERLIRLNPGGAVNKSLLVMGILTMSAEFCSTRAENHLIETFPGKNRSVIDIWRHAIYVFPEIDITELMEEIHYLCDSGQVFGQYCSVVRRAVFRNFNLSYTDMHFMSREYKISFNSWKNLHNREETK